MLITCPTSVKGVHFDVLMQVVIANKQRYGKLEVLSMTTSCHRLKDNLQ